MLYSLLVATPDSATCFRLRLVFPLFKLAVTVHQCLNGRAPPYLSEHCIPVSSADTRRHLRSANRHRQHLLYRVSGSTLTAVGRSQLLVRWPGILSRIHSLTHSSRLICRLVPWNTAIALDPVLYHCAAARVVNIAVGLLQARQRRPCRTAILLAIHN